MLIRKNDLRTNVSPCKSATFPLHVLISNMIFFKRSVPFVDVIFDVCLQVYNVSFACLDLEHNILGAILAAQRCLQTPSPWLAPSRDHNHDIIERLVAPPSKLCKDAMHILTLLDYVLLKITNHCNDPVNWRSTKGDACKRNRGLVHHVSLRCGLLDIVLLGLGLVCCDGAIL